MNKNLAIAINCFRQGGGMESYTFDLVRGFTADHQTVRIYAAQIDPTLPEYQHVSVQRINQKNIPKKLRPFFFTHQLQKQRSANEYLIACNPSDHADIFVCGGTHLGYLNNMGQTANLLDKLTIRRNRTNYQTAQKIMAHSALMKREMTELYGIDEHKIEVVYPPVNTQRFHNDFSDVAQTRQQYGFQEHETIFLFPSTGHKRKGLDLLAAFFEHTDLPVKLAVAGSPLPRPMKNVVELGFCSKMPQLYRAADYTIMASLYEPFGLVGVESILSGTRVVLSNNMACTEVMNEQAGFFFSRDNPASLADAITQAVVLKQNGQHKIHTPQAALTYNPSLTHHIQHIYTMLEK